MIRERKRRLGTHLDRSTRTPLVSGAGLVDVQVLRGLRAATGEKQGVKVKITGNSVWNGGTMLRSVHFYAERTPLLMPS